MVDRTALPDAVVRAEAWVKSYEVTWYLALAVGMAVGITALTAVGSGGFGPGAVRRGLLWGTAFAVVYYLIDAATGITRWPDSE